MSRQSMHREGDLFVLKWVGDFRADDVSAAHVHLSSILAEHRYFYILIDSTAAGGLGPDARRRIMTWPHAGMLGGSAIFGATRTIRAFVTLTMSVLRLLYPAKALPVKFVESEQAGREWIDRRRRELAPEGQD